MYRPLLLVLLFVGLCSATFYSLNVDPVNGEDIEDCRVPSNTPLSPCKTIKYALSPATSNDDVELTLLPGTYSGANHTGNSISTTGFVMKNNGTGPNPVIDCENTQAFVLNPRFVPFSISNIDFRNCRADQGGALSIVSSGGGSVSITGVVFTNNHANRGGAIYADTGLSVTNCKFSGNTATSNGGAIYATKLRIAINRNTFSLNTADRGAAIYAVDVGSANSTVTLQSNIFQNNTATAEGGAFFADNTNTGYRWYSFPGTTFDNNCAVNNYTDSYNVQVRCSGECDITDKGNSSGCTDVQTIKPPPPDNGGGNKSNKDRAIIIGVVVPFGILAILSIVLFMYIRKRHNTEMSKRDEYRKKILKALDNLPPEEQEAARLEAENADPSAPKCQLCEQRPISAPLPCGHTIVCSVCRTILLECPVKGCKKPTK